MKSIISIALTLAAVIGFSNNSNAQAPDAKVTKTQIVEASADDVWALLRQMDDIQNYSSMIGSVDWSGDHGVGGQRVCNSPDGKPAYTESIVAFDDNLRSYSYALVEGVPMKGMVNSFKVVDLGYQRSMIVWTSTFEAFIENPQMTEEQFMAFMDGALNEMIANLKQKAEKAKRS